MYVSKRFQRKTFRNYDESLSCLVILKENTKLWMLRRESFHAEIRWRWWGILESLRGNEIFVGVKKDARKCFLDVRKWVICFVNFARCLGREEEKWNKEKRDEVRYQCFCYFVHSIKDIQMKIDYLWSAKFHQQIMN